MVLHIKSRECNVVGALIFRVFSDVFFIYPHIFIVLFSMLLISLCFCCIATYCIFNLVLESSYRIAYIVGVEIKLIPLVLHCFPLQKQIIDRPMASSKFNICIII